MLLLIICLGSALLAAPKPVYTNNKLWSLSGKIGPNAAAILLNNKQKVADLLCDQNGRWEIKNIKLQEGENKLQVQKTGMFWTTSIEDTALVVLDSTPPQLFVDVMPELIKLGDKLNVIIAADEKLQAVNVLLPDNSNNDIPYNVSSGKWEGSFSLSDKISNGDYKAIVTAVDQAGNLNRKESRMFSVMTNPTLVIKAPPQNTRTQEPRLLVEGMVNDTNLVYINGLENYADEKGQFNAEVELFPGRQNIAIKAINAKTDRVSIEKRRVVRLLTFSDIAGHWAQQQIEYLATLGIMGALPGRELFAPEQNISRAELAVLLVNVTKTPLLSTGQSSSFSDVLPDYRLTPYIETAVRKGLMPSYAGKIFMPFAPVTRVEAITLIANLLGAEIPISAPQVFSDLDVTDPANSYSSIAVKKKILPPAWTKTKQLTPAQPVSRAEMAYLFSYIPSVGEEISSLLDPLTSASIIESSSTDADEMSEVEVRQVIGIPVAQAESVAGGEIRKVASEEAKAPEQLPQENNLPVVQVASPADRSIAYSPIVEFKGQVQNSQSLKVNGMQINLLSAEDPNSTSKEFSSKLDILRPGKNLIRFSAQNEGGYKTEVNRKVLLLNGYEDVPEQNWACKMIGSFTLLGFLTPEEKGKFGPKEHLTKIEAAQLLNKLNKGYKLILNKGEKPRDPISRGEMIKAVCEMEAYPVPAKATKQIYSDVKLNDPLSPYIEAAFKKGIIAQRAELKPQDPLTRETAVAFLYNTRPVLDKVRKLLDWEAGFDQVQEQVGERSSDLKLNFKITPPNASLGSYQTIEITTSEDVENVFVTFPDQVMQQLSGNKRTWQIRWLVPVQDLSPGKYRLDVMLIRPDGSIVQKQTPEINLTKAGK
ncbi:MAG: S-layer homology domain-containing protein [Candidatus Margulisiibacteriota bacterium]|jgi:hypothetical protein